MEKAIYVLAAAIVIAGFAVGGFYTSHTAVWGERNRPLVVLTNRFTGAVFACDRAQCKEYYYGEPYTPKVGKDE